MTALFKELNLFLNVLQFFLGVLARIGHFLDCYDIVIFDMPGKINISKAPMTYLLEKV